MLLCLFVLWLKDYYEFFVPGKKDISLWATDTLFFDDSNTEDMLSMANIR